MGLSEPIIRNINTGIPGLDAILGGGLCEYSFNLIMTAEVIDPCPASPFTSERVSVET